VVNRKTVQAAPSPAYQRRYLALLAALLGGCGGHALHGASDGPSAAGSSGEGGNTELGGVMASGGNAQGGGGVASGGQTGAGGGMSGGGGVVITWSEIGGQVSGGSSSAPSATGGVTVFQGGSVGSGQDGGEADGEISDLGLDACGDKGFWDAISVYVIGTGQCGPYRQDLPHLVQGNLVFDSEGQIIGVTLAGVSQTYAVSSLASYRWPCMAGQTIPFSCIIYYDH
jgi:hypothetical protein